MTKLEEVVVWGSVITNGKKFYLLAPKPAYDFDKRFSWKKSDTLCWLVTDSDSSMLEHIEVKHGQEVITDYLRYYKASYIVFGTNSVIELLDNPTTRITVEFLDNETAEEV